MKRSDILSRPSASSWDEARQVAEVAALLVGICWFLNSSMPGCSMQGCSDAQLRVFGVLLVSTPSLFVFGELVIGADRRARYRSAVLAEERQRIMSSVFDEPSPRTECAQRPFSWPR